MTRKLAQDIKADTSDILNSLGELNDRSESNSDMIKQIRDLLSKIEPHISRNMRSISGEWQ